MTMTETYPPPVDKLLTLGETRIHDQRNYLKMGFTHANIPDLIRLVEDWELSDMPWDENGNVPSQVYAQVHAWRALAQLGAIEAIPAFIGLLRFIDEADDDFVGEEIPVMLGKLGAPAIEPCRAYLAKQEHDVYGRIATGHALSEIGKGHPETHDACVQAMMSTLEDYRNDDETVNGEEKGANALAASWLVSDEEVRGFVQSHGGKPSKARVESFAREHRLHPGIVVGRMRHMKLLSFSHLRGMLVKVRDRLGPWLDGG